MTQRIRLEIDGWRKWNIRSQYYKMLAAGIVTLPTIPGMRLDVGPEESSAPIVIDGHANHVMDSLQKAAKFNNFSLVFLTISSAYKAIGAATRSEGRVGHGEVDGVQCRATIYVTN